MSTAGDMGSGLSVVGDGRAELVAEVQDLYVGYGDGEALLAAFRAAAVYVPLWDRESMWSADTEGMRWLYAFTSEGELERFVRARAVEVPSQMPVGPVDYWTVRGTRLLEVAVPEMTVQTRMPCGVAVDVAGGRPFFLPPVAGIVPDAVALEMTAVRGGGEPR